MNVGTNPGDGSNDEPKRANKAEELALTIKNNSKTKAIVSAHRDEALKMFKTDAPASRMVALRMKNLSAMESSIALLLPSKLSSSLPSVLQELLVKSEEEAMLLFQIVNAHRDGALAMFKADSPASRMVSLRMENLSAMKSSMALSPTLPSVLQELLVKSEEEAMILFEKEHLLEPNSNSSVMDIGDSGRIDFGGDHDVGFGGEDANDIQVNFATAEYMNDVLIEDEQSRHSEKSPSNVADISNQSDSTFRPERPTKPSAAPSESLAAIDESSTTHPPSASSTTARFSNESLYFTSSTTSTASTPSMESTKEKIANENSKENRVSKDATSKSFDLNLPEEQGLSSQNQYRNTNEQRSTPGADPSTSNGKLISVSEFRGVSENKLWGMYGASIRHGGKDFYLGRYKLLLDAALAYDSAARVLKGPNWDKGLNFVSKQDHRNLREMELKQRRLNVDLEQTLTAISSKLDGVVSKIHGETEVYKSASFGGTLAILSQANITDKIADTDEVADNEERLRSDLKGFYYKEPTGRYYGKIVHGHKFYPLGKYELACDAALAYDEAATLLKGPKWIERWGLNFASKNDYLNTRALEMKMHDIDVDLEESLEAITSRMKEVAPEFVGGPKKVLPKIINTKVKSVNGSMIASSAQQNADSISKEKVGTAIANGQGSNEAWFREQSMAGVESEHFQDETIFTSDLKGPPYHCSKAKYESRIEYQGRRVYLGTYSLASDAALARDIALKMLKGSNSVNFSSRQDHIDMREKEMKSAGISVDSEEIRAAIALRMKVVASKISAKSKDEAVNSDVTKSVDRAMIVSSATVTENLGNNGVAKTQRPSIGKVVGSRHLADSDERMEDAAKRSANPRHNPCKQKLAPVKVPRNPINKKWVQSTPLQQRENSEKIRAAISLRVNEVASKISAKSKDEAVNSDVTKSVDGAIIASSATVTENLGNNGVAKTQRPSIGKVVGSRHLADSDERMEDAAKSSANPRRIQKLAPVKIPRNPINKKWVQSTPLQQREAVLAGLRNYRNPYL